ncbi:MAG: serine/threonine-protein kinase [Mycobacteriaceae bacterium]
MGSPRPGPVARAGSLVAGRYRLQSPIAGGSMGTVWLASDQLLNRTVAVKQVLASAETTDVRLALALREGRAAASFRHPHSVAVHDVVVDGGEPWLVMEHVHSRSLAHLVADEGRLPARLVAQVGAQLADALAAAHSAGVVHLDVKPGNVLISQGGSRPGQVKLADFGIARPPQHDGPDGGPADPPDDPDMITGTPEFMAPEVARGGVPVAASDVFALGATLYAAVEGVPPFGLTNGDVAALLRRVAAAEVPVPTQAGVARAAIMRMLTPDPRRRPSMTQARDELVAAAAGGRRPEAVLAAPFQVPRAPSSPPPGAVPHPGAPAVVPRRHGQPARQRWVLVAAAAVLVALAVAAALLLVLGPG